MTQKCPARMQSLSGRSSVPGGGWVQGIDASKEELRASTCPSSVMQGIPPTQYNMVVSNGVCSLVSSGVLRIPWSCALWFLDLST